MTLAILDTIPVAIGLTGASLGSYLLFSFVFGHLGHYFGVYGPLRRASPS